MNAILEKAQFNQPSVGRIAVPVAAVRLRHLRTSTEIEDILHLREEIDLSAASVAESNFWANEKKEMNADSWVHLNSMVVS